MKISVNATEKKSEAMHADVPSAQTGIVSSASELAISMTAHALTEYSHISEYRPMHEILHYVDASNNDIFQEWLNDLRDRTARIAVQRRVDRLARGNVGDCKFCRDGVWELRIDTGPGYRVYYATVGKAIVLLLSAGDKRTQKADINKAVEYLADYRSHSS